MKHPLRILAAAFGSFVTLSTMMPAYAANDDLAGDWMFETSQFEGDCMIKGVMTFKKTQLTNTYQCHFLSEQICGAKYYHTYIKVSQDCTAQKVGKQVAVKSRVAKVLEYKSDIPDFVGGYLADNFVVAFKSLSEMLGDHYDEQRQLKARFWRDTDLIS